MIGFVRSAFSAKAEEKKDVFSTVTLEAGEITSLMEIRKNGVPMGQVKVGHISGLIAATKRMRDSELNNG